MEEDPAVVGIDEVVDSGWDGSAAQAVQFFGFRIGRLVGGGGLGGHPVEEPRQVPL